MNKIMYDLSAVLTAVGMLVFKTLSEKCNPPLRPGQVTIQAMLATGSVQIGDLLTQKGFLAMFATMNDLKIARDGVTVQHLLTYLRDVDQAQVG